MPKIAAILDPAFRTGQGAKGAWVLMKIRTDDGKEATIFAPAVEGDEVELAYNDQYKNYNATKVKPKMSTVQHSPDQLERIEKKVDQILFKLNGTKWQGNDSDKPPVEVYGEVPF